MRSHSVFVPFEGEHLAAVLTAPDSVAHGVAVFPIRVPLLGIAGATFWARATARLAEEGIASVRFECTGSGDSTGLLPGTTIAVVARQTIAAASIGMRAFEVSAFATAGACFTAAVALEAAQDPRCVSVVAIDTPGKVSRVGRFRRAAAKSRLVGFVRSHRGLRRVLLYDRVRSALRDRANPSVRASLDAASRRAKVLLIHDEQLERRDVARADGGFDVRDDIDFGTLRFDSGELNAGEERVLDTLVSWIAGSFADAAELAGQPSEVAGA